MAESKTAGTANMKDSKKLLWIARAFMIIALVGVSITSYYFYAPYVYPSLWRQIGQPMAHVFEYGAPLLLITVFVWIWPTAGGIIAVLYSLLQFWLRFGARSPGTLMPVPVYVLLYGLFLAGGMTNMILGLIGKKPERARQVASKRLVWIARVTALAPIFINAILYWLIYPLPFVLGSIPGLVTAGIAWFWPAPGGLLMLFLSIPGFFLLFESNWDFQQKLPVYIFCLTFITSGFLHIIIAWRGRRWRAG